MTVRNDEIEKVFAKAEKDDIWRSYLFDRLSKVEVPSQWLVRLKDRGYFDPKHNPIPYTKEQGYVTVPYWEATSYLVRVSEQNRLNPDEKVTSTLVNIIESLIAHKDESGKRIENTRTDWAIIRMIFDLPIDLIESDYIDFVKTALNSKESPILVCNELSEKILPYLIKNKATKILPNLLDIMLDFQINEKAYFDKFSSIIGEYYLQHTIEKHQNELFEFCSTELIDILMSKIRRILAIDKKTFGRIVTIEESSQNLSGSYESVLIGLLRDLLTMSSTQKTMSVISKLVEEPDAIFNRLAIYAINRDYVNLKDIFWKLEENPLNKYMLKHELYDLFEKHCPEFTEEQISRLLNWIENEDNSALKNYYKDPKEFEMSEARHKKEWLASLLKTCNPRVIEAYEKYSKVFPGKIEHPGYIVWSSGVIVSALPRANLGEALEGKSNEEIVEYLKTYDKKDTKKGEPMISCFDELESGFLDYVRKNPDKMSKGIDPFLDLPHGLQNSLLSGLNDAWKSKEKIEWEKVLKYCKDITEKAAFWEGTDNRRDLVVKNIAELVEVGTEDQNNAFDEKYLPVAEEVLLTLAKNDKSPCPSIMNLFTSVINSNKGAIYSTMIVYSRRYAQLKNERVWKKEIKDYFEHKITVKDSPIELYVTIGQYLLNINYLDGVWVKTNIDKIFPKDNEMLWKGAITGYAYGLRNLYADIYELVKNDGNYSKAIETDIDDDFVIGRLMEHICIAYLNGIEDINTPGNLISKAIESPKTQNLSEIVHFVWRLRQKLSEDQKMKIIELWKMISRAMKQKETEETAKILASLASWITVLDDLSPDTVELLKTSAKQVRTGHELFSLIDSLLKFVESKPTEVGEILNETITEETMLFHKTDDLQKIVTTLYEKGASDIANEICKKFWKTKQFFLQDIYDKYNEEK